MALQLITNIFAFMTIFFKNLRNWPGLWYYIKCDSQRNITFINKCQKIEFNIREEKYVRNGYTSSSAPEETPEKNSWSFPEINQLFHTSSCESISKVNWPRKETCYELFWFLFSRSMYWNLHEENSDSCLDALEIRQI